MKTVELKATSEKIDIKKNTITYTTGVESGPGILVLSDNTGEHGLLITDQIHAGGEVIVKCRPFQIPAKKYSVGEVVATLIVLE